MDIMKEVYKIIGSRLKIKRVQFNVTQSDIGTFDLTFIDKNIISSIENGKLFKTRRTFITDEELLIFQYFFRTNKGHIIFGESDQEIEELVFKLYKYVAYNMMHPLENEYVNSDEAVSKSGKALQEAFQFSALYSCYKLYFGHIFLNNKQMKVLKTATMNEIHSFYNELVLYFWEDNKNMIISSFIEFFKDTGDFNMKNFEYLLKYKWMNIHLKKMFNDIEIKYRKQPLHAVGYHITDDLLNNIKDIINYYETPKTVIKIRNELRKKNRIELLPEQLMNNIRILINDSKNQEASINIKKII